MSVQAMARVWDLDLPHAERLVLLAMADHADHIGDNIYPSIGLIAWKTGYGERQVQRIIKSLVKMEILCVVDQPIGRTTIYRMDLSAGTVKAPYPRQNVTPVKMSPLSKRPSEPRQNVTPTPDIAMSPKPSLNHQRTGGARANGDAAAVDQTVVDDLMVAGLDRSQALAAAAIRTYTADELSRLQEWRRTSTARKPGAVLWNCLKHGDLPDDLPPPPPPQEEPIFVDGKIANQEAYERTYGVNKHLYHRG